MRVEYVYKILPVFFHTVPGLTNEYTYFGPFVPNNGTDCLSCVRLQKEYVKQFYRTFGLSEIMKRISTRLHAELEISVQARHIYATIQLETAKVPMRIIQRRAMLIRKKTKTNITEQHIGEKLNGKLSRLAERHSRKWGGKTR